IQRHRPKHLVNREGRPRGLVRFEGWSRDLRREGWSRDLRHEGRCRDIGPGTSSILKVDPVAWSVVKVDLETSDMKIDPETSAQALRQSLGSAQGHEGRCRETGPGTSSLVKVGPWAWSDVKVGPETRDVKIGPETSDKNIDSHTS